LPGDRAARGERLSGARGRRRSSACGLGALLRRPDAPRPARRGQPAFGRTTLRRSRSQSGFAGGLGLGLRREVAKSFFMKRLKYIWSYRPFLFSVVGKELKLRYAQSLLGPLWLVLEPLLMVITY